MISIQNFFFYIIIRVRAKNVRVKRLYAKHVRAIRRRKSSEIGGGNQTK